MSADTESADISEIGRNIGRFWAISKFDIEIECRVGHSLKPKFRPKFRHFGRHLEHCQRRITIYLASPEGRRRRDPPHPRCYASSLSSPTAPPLPLPLFLSMLQRHPTTSFMESEPTGRGPTVFFLACKPISHSPLRPAPTCTTSLSFTVPNLLYRPPELTIIHCSLSRHPHIFITSPFLLHAAKPLLFSSPRLQPRHASLYCSLPASTTRHEDNPLVGLNLSS